MAKKNDDFFVEKKEWSKVKDELFGCYFKPYLQKILRTKRPIVYVDCFAGKGKFEDGLPGSPLIALEIIQECLEQTKAGAWHIKPYFIDLNYAADLKENLKEYPGIEIRDGKYEDNIIPILQDKATSNVFLYIDPYGIKALNFDLFVSFSTRFSSIEMLINFNTFGFLREACRVLGIQFKETALLTDLIEYESTQLLPGAKSVESLNRIAGGNYWRQIIEAHKSGLYDIYEAERRFAAAYCKALRESYEYVLNMPLKIKRGQVPKYRMIHVTNHPAGCLLMADNIQDRWQYLENIQSGGQQSLFEETPENDYIDDNRLRDKVIEHLTSIRFSENLSRIMADFFTIYGPICKQATLRDIYLGLEANGHLEIKRNPPVTKTNRESKFMEEKGGKTVKMRWLR